MRTTARSGEEARTTETGLPSLAVTPWAETTSKDRSGNPSARRKVSYPTDIQVFVMHSPQSFDAGVKILAASSGATGHSREGSKAAAMAQCDTRNIGS